ncbi:MAG: class I adenylate-forming enzyme family protein [Acidimicrobiales bacterium]
MKGTNSHPLLSAELQDEYRRLGYWEDLTLAMMVESWAERDPHRIAVTGETQLTYAELWERARRVAGSLREGGLEDGEVLLAVMSNCWQGVVLEVAASVLGACYCPRSAKISPTAGWNLFEQLDVRGVVLSADLLASAEWSATLARMASQLPDHPIMLQGDGASALAPYPRMEDAASTGTLATRVNFARCRPCLVLSTGGSTGQPKSILHCSESLIYAVRRFGEDSGYSERDVHVSFLPYGHAAGSLFEIYMPVLFGASILPINRWHAQTVAQTIEKFGGTYFITMGTHIFDLLAMDPDYRRCLASLRLLITGAGSDTLFLEGERELGVKMVRDYGFSECPGHALGRPDDPPEVRLCQDGVPFSGMTTRILDAVTGAEAAVGKAGEYQCLGPNLFMGYAGVAELTANGITEDGFYMSGDLMARTADGYITWKGRTKDIIRRGGLQIDAIELEGMLGRHVKISTVVVVGEPHPRLGERAVIVAVAEFDDDPPMLEELCEYLLEQGVEKQSLPERLVLVEEIPKTELGKFHRIEVQRRLAE